MNYFNGKYIMVKYGSLVLGICTGFALAMIWNSINSSEQGEEKINLEKPISTPTLSNANNTLANPVAPSSEDNMAAVCAKFAINKDADREHNSGPIERGVKKVALSDDQRKEYQQQQRQIMNLEAINNLPATSEWYSPPLNVEQAATMEQQRISDTVSEGAKVISNNPLQDPAIQKEEQMKYQ